MNSTYLLAATPKILRDQDMVKTSSYGNKGYGTPASEVVNRWGRDLIKEWLISKSLTDENILNVQSIKSPMLVEELIRWNPDGNFDRVSALGMLMILAQDKFKIEAKIEQNVEDNIERWNNHFSKLKERR
jgi:ribosomal protein S13